MNEFQQKLLVQAASIAAALHAIADAVQAAAKVPAKGRGK